MALREDLKGITHDEVRVAYTSVMDRVSNMETGILELASTLERDYSSLFIAAMAIGEGCMDQENPDEDAIQNLVHGTIIGFSILKEIAENRELPPQQ